MHFCTGLGTFGKQDLCFFALVSSPIGIRISAFCIGLASSGEQDLFIFKLVSPLLVRRIYALAHWSHYF